MPIVLVSKNDDVSAGNSGFSRAHTKTANDHPLFDNALSDWRDYFRVPVLWPDDNPIRLINQKRILRRGQRLLR
ncbi:MAG: hypothetical protein AUJ34_02595 [Parcubacteria group bacterium CG1_02_41_12]|nr:MAG: hypothetical protein AUJ34_02595 [Parcubacteria group bacterium CG1_02_41_12]